MGQKEGYYAALERQRAGENTLRERLEKAARQPDDESFDALETMYAEVGMKAFTAFNSCLEWLTQLGRGGFVNDRLERSICDAVANAFRDVREELAALKERFSRLEGNIAALEAGMRRIDKFTLEAFRNLQELEEEVRRSPRLGGELHAQAGVERGRLPKDEAARLALEAGQRMKAEGRRITLASVAREAGLKYGQIVYAFGNKQNFIQALMGERRSVTAADSEARRSYDEETATA